MGYRLQRLFQNMCRSGLCFFCLLSGMLSLTNPSSVYAQEYEQAEITGMHAYAYCLYDARSNRVLYEKHGNERLAMASTTKIMTLVTLLEHADINELVTVSAKAAAQPDVQLNICTGEQYRVEDLLYSLMLESHNDVAVALAEHVGGSVEGFAAMMNAKATEIGLCDTHFITPNGLDAEGHYSTAVEMAKLSAYALKNDHFRKIIQTTTHSFQEQTKGRNFTVSNKNRFLYMMKGAIGIKTGFTGKAGYCFVGAVEQGEHLLVSVVLACGWPPHKEYKWADTKKLMEYGLSHYREERIWDRAEIYYMDEKREDIKDISAFFQNQNVTMAVIGGTQGSVRIGLKEEIPKDATMLLAPWDTARAEITWKDAETAPIKAGEVIGNVTIWLGDEIYDIYPIVTKENIPKKDFCFCFRHVFKLWYNNKNNTQNKG